MLIPEKNGQGKLSLSSHSWKISLLFVLSQNKFGSLGRTSWHGKHLWYNPSNDSIKKTHGREVQSRCSILTRPKEIERQRNSFPLTSLIDHSHHSLTPSSTFWKICLTILDFFCWISSPFTRQFGMKKLTFFEIKRHSVIGLVVDRSVTSSLGHHRLCWLLAATSEYHGALAPAFFDVWKEPLLTWNPYSILKELHKLYHMGLVALMHGILATIMVH